MARIPRDRLPDSTLALLADPYGFISKRCRRHGSDVFEARILLQRTICMTGSEAARIFYDPQRFRRSGAAPGRIEKSLFGRGGVQGLDDGEHRRRKQMFLSLMTRDKIDALSAIVEEDWLAAASRWSGCEKILLYDELQRLLARAVCRWADVPLHEDEVERRTRELTALFDAAGAVGPRHWAARGSRKLADRWMAGVVDDVREGRWKPAEGSACETIAWHRDDDGKLLPAGVAAVELLNVLRPTVAVSVFLVFATLALHRYPQYRERLLVSDPARELFVQEVRRFYPFFPAVAARVRHDFEWRGLRFTEGRRVLFDLYGTNHDARIWENPQEFRPERFRERDIDPFAFVPQGGGSYEGGHRCPGEWITMAVMETSLGFLAGRLSWTVPQQDLSVDLRRLPALPKSHFVLSNLRLHEPLPLAMPELRRAAAS